MTWLTLNIRAVKGEKDKDKPEPLMFPFKRADLEKAVKQTESRLGRELSPEDKQRVIDYHAMRIGNKDIGTHLAYQILATDHLEALAETVNADMRLFDQVYVAFPQLKGWYKRFEQLKGALKFVTTRSLALNPEADRRIRVSGNLLFNLNSSITQAKELLSQFTIKFEGYIRRIKRSQDFDAIYGNAKGISDLVEELLKADTKSKIYREKLEQLSRLNQDTLARITEEPVFEFGEYKRPEEAEKNVREVSFEPISPEVIEKSVMGLENPRASIRTLAEDDHKRIQKIIDEVTDNTEQINTLSIEVTDDIEEFVDEFSPTTNKLVRQLQSMVNAMDTEEASVEVPGLVPATASSSKKIRNHKEAVK